MTELLLETPVLRENFTPDTQRKNDQTNINGVVSMYPANGNLRAKKKKTKMRQNIDDVTRSFHVTDGQHRKKDETRDENKHLSTPMTMKNNTNTERQHTPGIKINKPTNSTHKNSNYASIGYENSTCGKINRDASRKTHDYEVQREDKSARAHEVGSRQKEGNISGKGFHVNGSSRAPEMTDPKKSGDWMDGETFGCQGEKCRGVPGKETLTSAERSETMATNGSLSVEASQVLPEVSISLNRDLADLGVPFLSCDLCLNEYDTKARVPRILPCLHVYCERCVQERVRDKVIVCPACECNYLIKENIEEFLVDRTRDNIRDFVKVREKRTDILCKDCPDRQNSCFFCKDCFAFLCGECKNAHLRNFITRNHVVIPNDQINQSGIQPRHRPEVCKKLGHDGSRLEFYCNSCAIISCKFCILLHHDPKEGHKVLKFKDVYRQSTSGVTEANKRLKEKLKRTKQLKGEIENVIQDIDSNELRLSSDIDAEINRTIAALENRRGILKESLRKKCQQKRTVLMAQEDTLRKEILMMTDSVVFCNYQLRHALATSFLEMESTLLKRLSDVRNRRIEMCPKENSSLAFSANVFQTLYREILPNLGSVTTSSVFPLATKVEVHDVALGVHSECLRITPCDSDGTPQFCSKDCVNIQITDPVGQVMTEVCDVKQLPSGQFSVTLTPDANGEYTVMVEVMGVNTNEISRHFRVKNPGEVDKWLGEILCSGFVLDAQRAHEDRIISKDCACLISDHLHIRRQSAAEKNEDNTDNDVTATRTTIPNGTNGVPKDQRLSKYCGTIGSKPFEYPGCYYYEMEVTYQILVHLVRNAMVFEIGLGSLESVYNSFYVGAHAQAWSFSAERCTEHNQVCHKFRHKRELLTHLPLSSDLAGTSVTKKYGFLLDLRGEKWMVVDCTSNRVLYVFKNVKCNELRLWPVFGTYNPFSVDVKMKLITGHNIEKLPDFL